MLFSFCDAIFGKIFSVHRLIQRIYFLKIFDGKTILIIENSGVDKIHETNVLQLFKKIKQLLVNCI
ncbi:MAG: hypothetical protein AUJ98_04990 [Bacteroidetes bacterium CG2_30_33_31]|nr:MAG: hypothetical protein AUJ98_04990 [Bacteroidetes bacterium CG2_30_33_31]